MHSDSPNDSIRGYSNLKHVGEGALDDSDESGSDEESALVVPPQSDSDDDEAHPPQLAHPIRPGIAVHPSPLSHQQHWTEDEGDNEDDGSPSPGSSSDSDGPSLRQKPKRARTKSAARSRTRSRSSTVASLSVQTPPKIARQASSASVRTVLASSTAGHDEGDLQRQEMKRDRGSTKASPNHKRNRSTTFVDEVKIGLSRAKTAFAEDMGESAAGPVKCSERVRAAEMRFRDLGWSALRDVLEDLADQVRHSMHIVLAIG